MRLTDLFKAAEMGDHVIASTPGTRKPIYASRGPAHEAYASFSPAEHMAAANVHTAKAKDLHISSARSGGSLTMKRQAQQHSQFATMHRQAAEVKPQKLSASMRGISQATQQYNLMLTKSKGAGSRGGRVIGKTRSGKPVYAKHDSAHSAYSTFSADDHKDAEKLHHDAGLKAQKDLIGARSGGSTGQHADGSEAIRKVRENHFNLSAEHSLMAA